MKLMHIADLHIGKQVHEFSMLEDQKYILERILSIAKEEKIDGLIIAGDVYDRSVPPAEAVVVLDNFLGECSKSNIPVMLISGNHDSPERLSFASQILEREGLYMEGVMNGIPKVITLEDTFGPVHFYLIPFAKPQIIRHLLQKESDGKQMSYEESMKAYLAQCEINEEERNICVTHHFITNQGTLPETCESETCMSVGGTDDIDVHVFDAFDYVALGHIHRPQKVGRDTVRYAGSPLKYSFSEVNHHKSVTIIEMKEKGDINVYLRELIPLRDMRQIKGEITALLDKDVYSLGNVDDYIEAILTDKDDIVDPMSRLRAVYKNIMHLTFERGDVKRQETEQTKELMKSLSSIEIFEEFYKTVSDKDFTEEKKAIITSIIEEAKQKGADKA